MGKVSDEEARQVFEAAGLRPMEPILGARSKWKSECQVCGHIYSPHYSSVRAGRRCPNCFKAWQAIEQRAQGLKIAIETCQKENFELVGEYLNAKTPTRIKCLLCGREIETTLSSLKQKSVKCDCSKSAKQRLEVFAPELFAEIDWELNPWLVPHKVGTGTRKKINWRCRDKNHPFSTSPATRVANGGNCPVCSGFQPEFGVNDFATLFPNLAEEFVADPAGELSLSEVLPGSQRKFIWKCRANGNHQFKNSPWERTRGRGCPICAGKKVVHGDNDLASNRPDLLDEWDFSRNGSLDPKEVSPGSNKKAFWVCKKGHSWSAVIASRNKGAGCEQCSWFEPGRNDLGTIGSTLLLLEWDEVHNGKSVREVSASSREKFKWLCSSCQNVFTASPTNRHFNGTGCPNCASTGFSPYARSTLYFLENPELDSRKIGKTNTLAKSNRIGAFSRRGWIVVQRWDSDDGLAVEFVERSVLTWIRLEKGLPQHLGKAEMRGMAGETETFSKEGVSNQEVVEKIEALFKKGLQSRDF